MTIHEPRAHEHLSAALVDIRCRCVNAVLAGGDTWQAFMADAERRTGLSVFYDTSENFHPFECEGRGLCRHCDRRFVPGDNGHDPATCALCDPEYDGAPNVHRKEAAA